MNNKTIIKKGEEMIDQLHKILNEYDANKIDAMLNIDGIDWISKFDNEMVKNGYAVIKDGKASVKMSPNETKLFLTVKIMGMHQVRFLLDALQKMTKSYKDEIQIKDKEIDTLKQIIDLKVLNEKVNGKTKL
jgi:hypothetical protein|tara:strand:+ start:643 stop:1038 length:396 start_codon:yes stop_codon:yes gene_type:complete